MRSRPCLDIDGSLISDEFEALKACSGHLLSESKHQRKPKCDVCTTKPHAPSGKLELSCTAQNLKTIPFEVIETEGIRMRNVFPLS